MSCGMGRLLNEWELAGAASPSGTPELWVVRGRRASLTRISTIVRGSPQLFASEVCERVLEGGEQDIVEVLSNILRQEKSLSISLQRSSSVPSHVL
ncbi:hypothetical protein BDZ91DRAFT_725825, partial [Kalaharituber pfeilii]